MGSSPKIPRLARDSSREHLHGLAVQYKAEADVLSGRACAEEQADGAGPCGVCRDCLHARIHLLEAALVSVHKTLSSRSVLPTHELAELEQFTYLVVTGGAVPAREDYETAREWTKR